MTALSYVVSVEMKETWIFFIVFAAVLLIILSGCDIQRRMLYYPGEISIADVIKYTAENGLQMWPDSNSAYQSIVTQKGPTVFKGTIAVFHGNAGAAMHRQYYFRALEPLGYRVVLVEYPGYGGRPGRMNEKNFVADARRAALHAKEEFGGPLYLWGESLGCGVASALAADPTLGPQGIVMLTPWDSLLNEAKAKVPWLPVRFLLKDSYNNVANLAGYRRPVAVIMSKLDEVIPNRLTKRLYETLSQPKRIWVFENAGHNDWPNHPGQRWWEEVMGFVSS